MKLKLNKTRAEVEKKFNKSNKSLTSYFNNTDRKKVNNSYNLFASRVVRNCPDSFVNFFMDSNNFDKGLDKIKKDKQGDYKFIENDKL